MPEPENDLLRSEASSRFESEIADKISEADVAGVSLAIIAFILREYADYVSHEHELKTAAVGDRTDAAPNSNRGLR